MLILLNYDPDTDQVSIPGTETMISTWPDLEKHEAKQSVDTTDQLCKLKAAGFDVGEIMQLKREGMV